MNFTLWYILRHQHSVSLCQALWAEMASVRYEFGIAVRSDSIRDLLDAWPIRGLMRSESVGILNWKLVLDREPEKSVGSRSVPDLEPTRCYLCLWDCIYDLNFILIWIWKPTIKIYIQIGNFINLRRVKIKIIKFPILIQILIIDFQVILKSNLRSRRNM
jgi:hypothetical protein